MAKNKSLFVCQACGATYPRWMGKCEECGAWNTIVEEAAPANSPAQRAAHSAPAAAGFDLSHPIPQQPRLTTGSAEFDRVLGGGLVPGSCILLGGDPGIGKSTLLLQTVANIAQAGAKVLYLSGEESPQQIQNRAQRLGLERAPVQVVNVSSLATIQATLAQGQPVVAVVDSIQTVTADHLEAAPGTVSQVRLAAHALIQQAKASGLCLLLVGHVTKDGQLAGPRVLEHMVDTVLYFEGERGQHYRLLRAYKNRFGATNEIGVFDMVESGLQDVTNPSHLFLAERAEAAPGSAVTVILEGTRPLLVEVQALVSHTSYAQPRRTAVGFDPNRLAMLAAVLDKHGGFTFNQHDIFVNVTGGLRLSEPAADVALAAALLSSLLNRPLPADHVYAGEVGLAGELRAISHTDLRLREAAKLGFNVAVMPSSKEIMSPPLAHQRVRRIRDLLEFLG